ncbi:MAG: signal peptidase II [Clostridia bacterium]|nr:signal peptidase II [Clostridia bacterium]
MNYSDLKNKAFKKMKPMEYLIYISIIAFGIIVDQLTKFIVASNMAVHQSIPLIEDFLHITYTTNDGAAFGSMDSDVGRMIFMVVSSVMIVAMLLYLFLGHAENRLYGIAASMIISGGIGNMIDRLGFGFYVNKDGMGEVIDFIDFCGIWNAIFNGADSFVCVGAGLLVLALVLDIIKESKAQKESKK